MTRLRPLGLLMLALFVLPLVAAAPEGGGSLGPTVVVYPLTSTGRSGAETGSNVSVLLATKIAELGGVSVKPYTPGTARPGYLDAARGAGADYYVTGFMTPVGPEVSLIVQVVSTASGSVVYSTTTMARTYADAVNQADALHDAILRHAGRGLPGLGAPLAAASAPPAPSASDAGSVNLTKAFGRKRRGNPVAQASAKPLAAAAAPVPAATSGGRRLVAQVGGPASVLERAYAATALAAAFRRDGTASGTLAVSPEDAAAHVAELCKANAGTRTLYATTLTIETGAHKTNVASIDIAAYDCSGAPTVRRHVAAMAASGRSGTRAAIDRAVNDAVSALQKPAAAG